MCNYTVDTRVAEHLDPPCENEALGGMIRLFVPTEGQPKVPNWLSQWPGG